MVKISVVALETIPTGLYEKFDFLTPDHLSLLLRQGRG